ncbi:MAG: hypothetical protein L6R39_001072 [Caloplaca ligustica]|nr:MAG: hypothetical protein L6R39_001072 [Caloplaca ligustica]
MDPLSVSASAITIGALAVQTVSTIKKAHDLYSAIKDAPENLRSLLEELQLLSTLLASFTECARPHHGSGGGLVIALAYCKDTLESIQTFSIDLENAVLRAKWASRQWTALKITFQERKLKGHLNRLERAKSLLSLAHQICMQ